mgnify:CR=1 FL=1
MPAKEKLNLDISKAHAVENNAGSHAQRMGGPPRKVGAVFDRVELVHMSSGHAKCVFDNRCGNVTDSAVVVAINAEWNEMLKTDQPEESLNDPYAASDVAGGREADVAGMLALFAILPVFLCAVLDERASDRGAGGIKCKYLINRDANLIIRGRMRKPHPVCSNAGCLWRNGR